MSVRPIGTITTDVIKKYMLADEERYSSEEAEAELVAKEERVREKEEERVMDGHVCPVTRPRISGDQLREDLKKNFYDAEKMKSLWCTVDSALYSIEPIPDDLRLFLAGASPDENPAMVIKKARSSSNGAASKTPTNSKERRQRLKEASEGTYPSFVHESLRNFTIIGKPSVDGIAASVDFGGIKRGFVIKTPQKGKDPELLTHELVIGTELNKLRRHIPNFALIFGGFKCSPPILTENTQGKKTPKGWCTNTTDGVRYVLYENVFIDKQELNADFRDFAKSCTAEQWLSLYIQTLLALQFASEAVGFTHNDLHSENILVRQVDEPLLVPYGLENRTYYTYSNLIPTFIDYGRSVVKIDGEWFGDYTQVGFGSDAEGTHPFQDAYKLLMFSLADLQDTNPTVFSAVSSIFEFFNEEEDVVAALARQRPYYYVIPYETPQIKGKGLYDLIDYIVEQFPYLNLVYDDKIIDQVGVVCPTGVAPTSATCRGSKTVRETLINYTQPKSLEQLYEVAPFASEEELSRMLKNFKNPQKEIRALEEKLETTVEEIANSFEEEFIYHSDDYTSWLNAIREWETTEVDFDIVVTAYADLRDDGETYLSYLSVFSSLYQHSKILDFALAKFEDNTRNEWHKWVCERYEESMCEAASSLFAVLQVAKEHMYALPDEYREELEGDFDTPIDLIMDMLAPYVKRKYLDLCISCKKSQK